VIVRRPGGHEDVLGVVVGQLDVADRIPDRQRVFGVRARHNLFMRSIEAYFAFRGVSHLDPNHQAQEE